MKCNKNLPAEGGPACQGGSSVVEEPFYVSAHPSIFAPPPSSSSTCLPRISYMRQSIFNVLLILTKFIDMSHFVLAHSNIYQLVCFGSDLISMCQRCSSSLCLFSTAFCFCFLSLFSCSFLTRLLGLISTGSSGFTFF